MEIGEIFELQPPLDFRIPRQRTRAGARHIGEYTVEVADDWKVQRVRLHNFDVRRLHATAEQLGAMGVQLSSDNLSGWVASGDGRGLSSGRSAAVQQTRSRADQQRYKLRCFILKEDPAFPNSFRTEDLAAGHNASVRY